MKKHLPNVFTCLNLFSGCIATVMVFRNHLDWAAYLIFLAAFFDLLDGMLARMIGLNSAYGKELDSLADMVSFGFVPGAILFKLLQQTEFNSWPLPEWILQIIQFLPFVLTVFSALRLAKFNLDTRQTTSFIGLPTPAATLLVVSLPMILIQGSGRYENIILNPLFLLSVVATLSILLVAELPLFSLKIKSLNFRENIFQFVLLIFSVILVVLFQWFAVPLIFLLYLVLSFVNNKATSGAA